MHDIAIEELEQENRLLRARNDRLEAEALDAARWRQYIADTRRKLGDYAADTLTRGVDAALGAQGATNG